MDRLTRFEPLTGEVIETLPAVTIYPGKQFVTPADKMKRASLAIREELTERIAWFEARGKLLEAQRLKMRTEYDLEMMEEMGFCSGIENYSRHIAGRAPGSRPWVLLDFLPRDYLLVIDESHATIPQIGGMCAGDMSRKTVLVGINLLREGLDLPEVSLVAILDADKEGYLRSVTSLIQTAGRAARHLNGEVILYADVMTQSIQKFLAVSRHRRERQLAYNQEHGITPRSVSRAVEESLAVTEDQHQRATAVLRDAGGNFDVTETIRELEGEMLTAANNLEFEKAALLRDQVRELKRMTGEASGSVRPTASYGKARGRRGKAGFRR